MKKRLLKKKIKQLEVMVTTAQYAARYGFDMKVKGHDSGSRMARKFLKRRYICQKIGKWFLTHGKKISIGM